MIHRFIAIGVLIVMFSCTEQNKLDIQGHRGYRGLYPENSLIGFEKALEVGVTTLEMDLVISKDSLVVVSHEPFMNHEIMLDPNGHEISEADEKKFNLFQMSYDSIQLFDCGTKIHPRFLDQTKQKASKPLLRSVIQLGEALSQESIFYNIEIKSQPIYDNNYTPQVSTFVELVVRDIEKLEVSERTIFQSFDLRALEKVKEIDPRLTTALLVDESESIENKLNKLSFKPEIISPYFKLLNSNNVTEFQESGFKVIPWTVNSITDIQTVLDLEVDGIISDFPERVIQLNK